MNAFSHVPPGFRFHPTDEELVDYYLRKKVASKRIDLDVIKDVDLYRIEPWDLQELCSIGTEETNEWYFFSHKDKKYPTGTRTNRATKAGFWKATGRDKAIYTNNSLVGMRKTLVFYKGRAPNGQKSDWIMHEYRLETNENATPQEEGWVVCRVFKKRLAATMRKHESPCWYDDQVSFMPDLDSPVRRISQHPHPYSSQPYYYSCKQELGMQKYTTTPHHDPLFLQLPHLESPKINPSSSASNCNTLPPYLNNLHQEELIQQNYQQNMAFLYGNNANEPMVVEDQGATDWRVLDKFVASQLSQGDIASKGTSNYSNNAISAFQGGGEHMNMVANEIEGSASTSISQIDMWK